MRFREFKILNESPEQNKFYTVGDSHAVAVAHTGGKSWINLAINGKSSTDAAMLANIAKIPKGAVVLVSQGANDTSIALSQGGKTPPQAIAQNVANVVDKVQAQGASVVFLLFPVGKGRGDTNYQEKVRDAIRNAVGSVPIIDLNDKPLQTDQVHAQMGAYKEVANQVVTQYGKGVTLGPTDAKPIKVSTKETTKDKDLVVGPPYPPEHIPRVKDLQTKLQDIGYSVGSTRIDGKFGPRTSAALAAFIKDYNIDADSGKVDAKLLAQLEKVASGSVPKVKTPTPVNTGSKKAASGSVPKVKTPTPVNTGSKKAASGAGKSLTAGIKNPGAALKEPEFMSALDKVSNSLGVDKDVLLKVMKFESQLDPQAVNPKSKATGLIQFMPNTAAGLGTSVEELYNMSATEQLKFVEKYYKMNGVKPGASVGDLYILTFMPAAADKPDNFVLGNARGGKVFNLDAGAVYSQNSVFDKDRDGIFTKGDVINTINSRYA